jgi:hypothetical protein
MTILLNYHKAKPVDRAKFIETYTAITGYRMLCGTPLLVSVEGTYIKANDIPELLVSRKYSKQVNDWLLELKNPTNVGKIKLEFKWRR